MVKAQTYFPSSIALLKDAGFRMKGALLLRPQTKPVEYLDAVEFQWSSVTEVYYVNLGVVMPRLSEAFGYDEKDPFKRGHLLIGNHRLGRHSWPEVPLDQLVNDRFGQSPAHDARMRSLLEQRALPWFDALDLSGLAKSWLMWPPFSVVLLHMLGERHEAAVLSEEFEQTGSDPDHAERVTMMIAEARDAIEYLNRSPG